MKAPVKLNAKNLSLISREVEIPSYDRSKIKAGIVHVGIGGFHRSHEAFYTDQVLHNHNEAEWGICGVAMLEADRKIFDVLSDQDGLYTLIVKQSDGTITAKVIGSIIEYLFAPGNPAAVIEKMASPEIKIITLTITEGGYNFNSATGEFQSGEASIQEDLNNPRNPGTVFGYITQAFKLRRDRGLTGLTVQSCDNIQKNGDILKRMLSAYVSLAEPGLNDWIERHITFPNSMVDRITPLTTLSDIENLRSAYGIDDSWPVVCEPFIQWVSEDKYSNGRPDWESAGVEFVPDVGPYEKMKIRLLNAGHSLLGFLGTLNGSNTIDEAVRIPELRNFLREFMDLEVTPVLTGFGRVRMEDYKDILIQRFGNPYINDRLSRICQESSAKIPKFIIPTITEQLNRSGPVKRSAAVIAAWCRYLELAGTQGYNYEIQDAVGVLLHKNALASVNSDPLAFLKIETIFGDLANSGRFVDAYSTVIDSLRKNGVIETINNIDHLVS
jgi:mannitol 2-dehydrogenase